MLKQDKIGDMMSILEHSTILRPLKNANGQNVYEISDKNDLYLFYPGMTGGLKVRCIKNYNEFKIFAYRHDQRYAITDYYVLDTANKTLFHCQYDTCILGGQLSCIISEIQKCKNPRQQIVITDDMF
jgi:hypothetical protein